MNPVVQERVLRPLTPRASKQTHSPVLTVIVVSDTGVDSDRARRILNIGIAAIALVLVAPVMLLIGLAIMVTSPGPILYTQTRVGINRRKSGSVDGRRRVDFGGKLFKIYKFRTMYQGSDSEGEVWASQNDPRITPVGRILRNFRLDELPQLINVLTGDMNLVGPRPEQPKIFSNLRRQITDYSERQRVLPGITGLAQVRQHYDRSIEDVRRKVSLDLEYISSCSWRNDLKVLVETLPVVIFKRGAW